MTSLGKKGEDQIRHSDLFELEGKKCLRKAKHPNVDFQLYGESHRLTVGLGVASFYSNTLDSTCAAPLIVFLIMRMPLTRFS